MEIFTGDDTVRSILTAAHRAGVPVVASNHHFHETPDQETILEILTKMDQMGADILKIAVMPQSRKDVLTLLSATEEMDRRTTKPLITMSMGPVGMISRLCGEVFGSALTFGAIGKVSAPGQIGCKDLAHVLNLIHRSMESDRAIYQVNGQKRNAWFSAASHSFFASFTPGNSNCRCTLSKIKSASFSSDIPLPNRTVQNFQGFSQISDVAFHKVRVVSPAN